MLVAALRRFAGLLLVISGGTILVSLAIGLAAGSSVGRSVSVGFYLVGSFLLIAGFFTGNRGPVRVKGDPGVPVFGPLFQNRMLRWATTEEREESLSMSVVFVALGFALILIGLGADTKHSLF
jgi:4-amino-4-deoxy-L-arabinose transferase-like glycosyltransferase